MAIKLLLREDIDALGKKGEVVTVRPGFARNFLLPQGKALIADRNAMRTQERLRAEREKQAVVDRKDSEAVAERLKDITLIIHTKVDQMGHMYGSVSALDLHKMLEDQYEICLGKRDIQLKHPIKKLGKHTVPVKLKEDVEASFVIEIHPEGGKLKEEVSLEAEAADTTTTKETS